jgi:catechol 2,3-dioxygenase
MTMSTATEHPTLPATLRLGSAHLTVSDLERSLAFYEGALGLHVHRREAGSAALGAGEEDVLVLVEEPGARPAGRHAGLYHVALLYPSRLELARAGQRLAVTRTPIEGASDHRTHEAFYLSDPDGNGLELAADRPREAWPELNGPAGYAGGRPLPLDVHDLLSLVADAPPQARVSPGLRVGHVHLHVGDVARGIAFYCDVLGFELQANLGSAAFVSAGGYHHHLAFNVWRGEGVGPVPPGTCGLRHWTIELPSADDVAAVRDRVRGAGIAIERDDEDGLVVRDPWEIAVRFRAR